MKRTTFALIAFPFVAASVPYLCAWLTPVPWELGKGMIVAIGVPAVFIVSLLVALPLYAVIELRAAKQEKMAHQDRS